MMNSGESRDWSGLYPRQNESSVRYIQQGIPASKEQHFSCLSPLAFGKLGQSQRVLPLRVHTNKRKWFTSATDLMHHRGTFPTVGFSWHRSALFCVNYARVSEYKW